MSETELYEPKVWMRCPVCDLAAWEWLRVWDVELPFLCPRNGCLVAMKYSYIENYGFLIVSDEQKGRKFLKV